VTTTLGGRPSIYPLNLNQTTPNLRHTPTPTNTTQNCLALLVFVSLLWCTEALPLFVTSMIVPLLVVVLRVLVDRWGFAVLLQGAWAWVVSGRPPLRGRQERMQAATATAQNCFNPIVSNQATTKPNRPNPTLPPAHRIQIAAQDRGPTGAAARQQGGARGVPRDVRTGGGFDSERWMSFVEPIGLCLTALQLPLPPTPSHQTSTHTNLKSNPPPSHTSPPPPPPPPPSSTHTLPPK